jgi:large repetitive protein
MKKILSLLVLGMFLSMPALAQDKASQALVLNISAGTLSFPAASLPNGQVNLAYTGVSLTASGGLAPYTYTVTSGSLPIGLILSTTGAFSGTPTTAETSSFTVQVTDSEKPAVSATQTFSITIQSPLTITTTSLPAGNIGIAYSASIGISGGVAPYACAVSSGALPTGISLSPTGTAACTLSGTPSGAGTFDFTLTVTDSATGTPAIVRVRGTAAIPKR